MPNLSATKTHDNDPVSAGSQIGFTITISNSDDAGTGTAHDVALNDPLPAGPTSTGRSRASRRVTHAPSPETVADQTLECSFGDLAAGDSVSVHIVSGTAKADCATYQNVASVTASNHDELNPQASVTVQCPGLNISKTAADTSVNGGDSVELHHHRLEQRTGHRVERHPGRPASGRAGLDDGQPGLLDHQRHAPLRLR